MSTNSPKSKKLAAALTSFPTGETTLAPWAQRMAWAAGYCPFLGAASATKCGPGPTDKPVECEIPGCNAQFTRKKTVEKHLENLH